MQAIWKGSVSFGLVTIPVKVFAATGEKDVAFRQVHVEDGGRVRYKRFCEIDGEEVPYSDIAKGYELPDGQMLVLTADDFADLPLPSKRTVDVLEFVPAEEIDPVYVSRSYYLQADGPGEKPYVLLRDALRQTGQVAVVKVALRNREALGMVRPKGETLMLQTLLWPDEVRDGSFAVPGDEVEVRPQEVAMAESYIRTLETTFDPDRYQDEYRAALQQLIEAKSEGRELEVAEAPGPSGEVVDLMSALQASVDAAKQQRGEQPSPSAQSERTAPKKSTTKQGAAKKAAPAKKSTTKKDTAKKDTAKKDTAKKDTAKKDTAKKGTAKKGGTKQSPAKKSDEKTASTG